MQSNPDLIAAIKEGDEKLGAVGNPTNGQAKNRQTSRPTDDIATNEGIQRRNSGPFRPLVPSAASDTSAGKETTEAGKETADPRSVQSKPDLSQMSAESQRLAREITRETDKLGKVGNPGGGNEKSQARQDSLIGPSDTNVPHLPMSTTGARARSC